MVRIDEKEEKPFSACRPGADGDNRCFIQFIEDWEARERRIAELEEALRDCQEKR